MNKLAVYGLQRDIEQNQGKGVSLYIPGKTQLGPQDVFLGGSGTGVTDAMLNGSTRVFGNNASDTSKAFDSYTKAQAHPSPFEQGDIQAQRNAVIASNDAPRSDWASGAPSMSRLAMEQGQAQDAVGNAQNAAQLTGRFDNQDTLAQKTYDQGVRNDAIKNSQWDKSFDYNASNDAANRSISQQNADNSELSAGITRSSDTYSGIPAKFWSEATAIGNSNGVDPLLLAAIAQHETTFGTEGAGRDGFALGVGVYDKGNPNSNYQDAKGTYTKQLTWAAESLAGKFSGNVTESNIKAYQNKSGYATDPKWAKGVYESYLSLKRTAVAGTKTAGTKPSAPITAADTKIAQNQAIVIVNGMDSQGHNEKEILNYVNANASDLASKGVDIAALHTYITTDRYAK